MIRCAGRKMLVRRVERRVFRSWEGVGVKVGTAPILGEEVLVRWRGGGGKWGMG